MNTILLKKFLQPAVAPNCSAVCGFAASRSSRLHKTAHTPLSRLGGQWCAGLCSFSWQLLVLFLLGTCIVKILSVSLAGRLAGFRGLDLINLALTTNARGGPGIVLASIAFDAGIINAKFYTALVLVAVITSQFAGAWLDYVLHRGWPLLSTDKMESQIAVQGEDAVAADAA